jgi:plastocyanin
VIRRALPGLLLVLVCAAAGAFRPAAAQGTERRICIEPVSGAPGTRVTVPLVILEGGAVAAFQADVRFEPLHLAYAGSRLGPDPAATGGWVYDSQVLGAGRVRVLGYTFPPAGLSPGLKRLALLDFDVVAVGPIQGAPLPLSGCVLGDSNAASIPCAVCTRPGVEAAAPRFSVSLLDDGLAFSPARLVIESGDWVLWKHVGSFLTHTTTSGVGCLADGLWRGFLPAGGWFERRFTEPSGSLLPYFSEPDCGLGMTGQVEITDEIQLALTHGPDGTLLSWSGGSGRYRVHRSAAPSFVAVGTASFTPDGGETGMDFTDAEQPPSGQASFYLIVNSF